MTSEPLSDKSEAERSVSAYGKTKKHPSRNAKDALSCFLFTYPKYSIAQFLCAFQVKLLADFVQSAAVCLFLFYIPDTIGAEQGWFGSEMGGFLSGLIAQ